MSDVCPLSRCQWLDYTQLLQTSAESIQVLLHAERLAAIDRNDLINAVAENETPVHHADLGVTDGAVFTVEVTRQVRKVVAVHDAIVARISDASSLRISPFADPKPRYINIFVVPEAANLIYRAGFYL